MFEIHYKYWLNTRFKSGVMLADTLKAVDEFIDSMKACYDCVTYAVYDLNADGERVWNRCTR